MQELSLNILDIAENSVKAGASLITVAVCYRPVADRLTVTITDDGCGMDAETVRKVTDPFYTTRTTRKVGMGIPLFRMAAEMTGDVTVIGTLEHPVHAVNLDRTLEHIEEHYPDAIIIAVDAAVGRWDHVGLVTLEKGPLRPGLGVRKELAAVGDISITGIVGGAESGDPLFLQSIRLSMVMRLADCISRSICLGMRIIGRRVENFSSQAAPF